MATWECKEPRVRQLEPCGCLPAGFSRLRYFFGKHLSVADFKDEQRYHIAKQRFHNRYLHGAGVLCGLNVSLLESEANIIRVAKGAALDRCGREVVVGYDQCIDVGAWYQKERQRQLDADPETDWPAAYLDDAGDLPLCVVLRYDECNTHPEPAPRDPCSCAEGGCEFGRVDEDFELKLMVHSEAVAGTIDEPFPTRDQIADALAVSLGGLDLLHQLAGPITQGCPPQAEDTWILLSCFKVQLDPDDPNAILGVTGVGENYLPPVLLSTEVIQYLLAQLFVEYDGDFDAVDVVQVQWRKLPGTPETYQLIMQLSGELEVASIDQTDSFKLRKLSDTGWDPPGANAVSTEYLVDDFIPGPAIYVSVLNSGGFLEQGKRYQLYANPEADPIVDTQLRELRPRDFVWRFGLTVDSTTGDFVMVTPPF